jgi:hypothetical protein
MQKRKYLGRECRPKICVALPHPSDRMIANHIRQAVVRGTTSGAGWRRLKHRHRDIFSTADRFAVALSPSAQQLLQPLICRCLAVPKHSRRFSSRLLITSMPIEMTASELAKKEQKLHLYFAQC